MPLTNKRIEIQIKLAPNQTNQPQSFAAPKERTGTANQSTGTTANVFTGTSSNTVTLAGHRASLRVQNSGAIAGSEAQLLIWGLSTSIQDQLSTLGMVLLMIPRNTITITAGDDKGMFTVFSGVILEAVPDFTAIPDEPMRMTLNSQADGLTVPVAASSFTGQTTVEAALQPLATLMGWGFENSGVTTTIASPYLSGNPITQIRKIAQAANINASVINNTLCIWPLFGVRKGTTKPLVAPPPEGQMIGWPSYTQQGIVVKSLFDPRIVMGGQIQVKSRLQRTSGLWNVNKVDLALDQLMKGGQWMTVAYCYNPDFPQPLPPQA